MKSESFNVDCMDFIRELPDKSIDLAICDPPYGIGRDGQSNSRKGNGKGRKGFDWKDWDCGIPSEEYFLELYRVSSNQIIWGANYMGKYLPPSMGWIFWDKGQRINQSDGELAFTSFERALRVVEYGRHELAIENGETFHPTKKPIKLYRWLLDNYAKQGYKILDTHMGSQSSRIAAYDMGFDYFGCELDKDYFDAGNKRFELFKSQTKLF